MKLPAGKYYIGDPCYVLNTSNGFNWEHVLSSTGFFGTDTADRGGVFEYKGMKMFASSTAYGDGCYKDNHRRTYPVDGGMISAIPLAHLPLEVDKRLGHVVDFESDFQCCPVDDGGSIVIGNIVIETSPSEDMGF